MTAHEHDFRDDAIFGAIGTDLPWNTRLLVRRKYVTLVAERDAAEDRAVTLDGRCASLAAEVETLTAERDAAVEALREIEHLPYSVMGDAESDLQAAKQLAREVLARLGGDTVGDTVSPDEYRKKAAHIDDLCDELSEQDQVPPDVLAPIRAYAVWLRGVARLGESE